MSRIGSFDLTVLVYTILGEQSCLIHMQMESTEVTTSRPEHHELFLEKLVISLLTIRPDSSHVKDVACKLANSQFKYD